MPFPGTCRRVKLASQSCARTVRYSEMLEDLVFHFRARIIAIYGASIVQSAAIALPHNSKTRRGFDHAGFYQGAHALVDVCDGAHLRHRGAILRRFFRPGCATGGGTFYRSGVRLFLLRTKERAAWELLAFIRLAQFVEHGDSVAAGQVAKLNDRRHGSRRDDDRRAEYSDHIEQLSTDLDRPLPLADKFLASRARAIRLRAPSPIPSLRHRNRGTAVGSRRKRS